MKVSIVIPVYNVEGYIQKCLQSVADQTFMGAIECIIVDDCGNDDSIPIVNEFIHGYRGSIVFRVIHHQSNLGVSCARNTGIKAASGDYVFFLDSDDWLSPDCIQSLSIPLNIKPYDFVIGDFEISGFERSDFSCLTLDEKEYSNREEIILGYVLGKWPLSPWNKLCRLDFLKEKNLYFSEGLIHEDNLWCFNLACEVTCFYAVRKKTYYYHIHSNSIMTAPGRWAEHEMARLYVLNSIMEKGRKWPMVQDYVRLSADRLFYESIQEKTDHYNLYKRLSEIVSHSNSNITRGGNRIKSYVKNLHYSLPAWLGYPVRRLLAFLFKH